MAISLTCSILEKLGGIECKQDDPNLKGLKRYFNSVTNRGRANVGKASYAIMLFGFLVWYGTSKSKNKEEGTAVKK